MIKGEEEISVAVYWGRFNPPHKGHLGVIKKFNHKYNLTAAIGSSEHKNEKTNPFSGRERKLMLEAYLNEQKIKDVRVVTLNDGKSKSWAIDNLVKKCKPDVLLLSENHEMINLTKGKKIHVLSFKRKGSLSSTLIRDLIASDNSKWRNLTGKSVARMIMKLDGAYRIKTAYRSGSGQE
ncbi:MAG: adenylyltransferase/cytidyltransferase family protein [Nitrososphaerota archaeon]|nr:adenylyltransferase/cytidyltransferase family protein [Nitrososphaerota archaeon]